MYRTTDFFATSLVDGVNVIELNWLGHNKILLVFGGGGLCSALHGCTYI